ncbi:MAG TPA: hypothetical protein VGI60_04955 [Chthoniobacterales bacterium]|jgi:hypothetical protein
MTAKPPPPPPTLTGWNRLEPSTSLTELERGLQARIADPLWLLGRQWQLGEFLGEDAASPVDLQIDTERISLSRIRLRDSTTSAAIVSALPAGPLEAVIERESVLTGPSKLQRAIEAGQHFFRLLTFFGGTAKTLRGKFRQTYPVAAQTADQEKLLDPASRRFLRIMAGRAVDGYVLRAAVKKAGGAVVPPELGLTGSDATAAKSALTAWKSWYDARFTEPTGRATAWVRERMEYSFSVSAPLSDRELVLTVPEHDGGHLDWYSFDVSDETSLMDPPQTTALTVKTTHMLPVPLSYPGMPASRFWEFEDSKVNLSRYSSGPSDISKLLLVEFAMVYGDDWYRVPIDMQVGDLVRIDTLRVWDNFGGVTVVQPATQIDTPTAPWRMFAMSGDPALTGGEVSSVVGTMKGPWLFRAPSLAKNLNGDSLEEVVFTRDEMANLAWAIERKIECSTGVPVSRVERWLEQQATTTTTNGDATVDARYNIQTTIPDYWVPLVPVKRYGVDEPAMILRRGLTLLPSGEIGPGALGRVLDPTRALLIFEEEVPNGSTVVSRHWQLARWLDGSTWLWLARRKDPGTGEQSSGLRYDLIEK